MRHEHFDLIVIGSGAGGGTIGRALRTVYDDMLREDVPKDFIDLLRKLD